MTRVRVIAQGQEGYNETLDAVGLVVLTIEGRDHTMAPGAAVQLGDALRAAAGLAMSPYGPRAGVEHVGELVMG